MTLFMIPPAAAVRREVLLVVVAYALPLVLVGGAILVEPLGSYDWRPLALVASYLLFGAILPLVRRLQATWKERKRPRRPIDGDIRAAIVASVPALSNLTMVVKGKRSFWTHRADLDDHHAD